MLDVGGVGDMTDGIALFVWVGLGIATGVELA